MRRLLSIVVLACLAGAAGSLRADERYEFPGQDWERPPHGHAPHEYRPLRRNFGAVNLNPQRVTRRPNPNLLFRNGGWGFGYPWGYYFPFAWSYYAPWGWGPYFGEWGLGPWRLGFNSWSYRFGFAGGGPARSSNAAWTPGPTRLNDGWHVGPQGLARQVSDRRPPRGSLPQPTYDGAFYW